jgi:hypothetical protein
MAATYNTIPADASSQSDSQTLLPSSKSKTSIKRIVVAAAVVSLALCAVFATATQSKVTPSAVAQTALHSADMCAGCSADGCQCVGVGKGCDQTHCKNIEKVICDQGYCDQPACLRRAKTKSGVPSIKPASLVRVAIVSRTAHK